MSKLDLYKAKELQELYQLPHVHYSFDYGRGCTHWTDGEKRFLDENWELYDDDDLAFVLRRSGDSIVQMRMKRNLIRKARYRSFEADWSDSDVEFLRDHHAGWTDKELAYILDKTAYSIMRMRFKLGLRRR